MDVGRVEYYNTERGFGYLSHHKNSEGVYFEEDAYCQIRTLNDNPQQSQIPVFVEDKLVKIPKKGDWVIFEKQLKPKGPVAKKWGFASQKPVLTKFIGYEIEMSYRLADPRSPIYRIRYKSNGLTGTYWMGYKRDLVDAINSDDGKYLQHWWVEIKDSRDPWRIMAFIAKIES